MSALGIIDAKRLAELEKLRVDRGAHGTFAKGHCALELVAWLAKEPHSDHPKCTCPVIAAFVRRWNDGIRGDDDRTRVLLPLLPLLVGTRIDDESVRLERAYLAIDWQVRDTLPRFLRLAELRDLAEELEALTPIVDVATRKVARPVIDRAYDAAGDARQRTFVKFSAAADAAAYAAAAAAADADAAAAAVAALRPVVLACQESAASMVRRMCAVGRVREVQP